MAGEQVEIDDSGREAAQAAARSQMREQPPGLLVILAVEDGKRAFHEAIDEQLEAVKAWWGASGRGFEVVETREPASRHDVELFLEQAGVRETEPDVPLVVFLTGHGMAGSRHYLLLRETDRQRPLATALPSADVVLAALDSHSTDVLVIVNMCEAASVGEEIHKARKDLAATRSPGRLNVLATTGDRTAVLGKEFALVLKEAYTWLCRAGGITTPYLSMADFLDALEHAVAAVNKEYGRQITCPEALLSPSRSVPTTALPNPGYPPSSAAVQGTAEPLSTLSPEQSHWMEKASGRPHAQDPGWYFSGRTAANSAVTAFLHGPPGVLIVTGMAATGKTAVLGRVVTLSDPAFRTSPHYAQAAGAAADAVPPGVVTVAVNARNHSSLSLLKQLCHGVGVVPPQAADDVRQWRDALRTHIASLSSVTIVVDALDEALSPARCVSDVLAPLAGLAQPADLNPAVPPQRNSAARRAQCPGLRLLLGVRSSRPAGPSSAKGREQGLLAALHATFTGASEVRTDEDGVENDIALYVQALLDDVDGWDPQTAAAASLQVARKVQPSFLDAQRAAAQLRAEGPELLGRLSWWNQLATGTAGLLRADLDAATATGQFAPGEALALLRATAFARGRGLAWGEVWPAVAAAVHGATLESADLKIDALLHGRLSGYLSHDVEDERIVYRPAHDVLRSVLRCWPSENDLPGGRPAEKEQHTPGENLHEEQAVHASITAALSAVVRPSPGHPPPPYVRRHLADHAALGGVLDDTYVPAQVLAWESSGGIRGLLTTSRSSGPRAWLNAWAAVEPYLQHAEPDGRLTSLHLAYTAMHHPGVPLGRLPSTPGLPGSRLTAVWSQWRPPAPILAIVDHPVAAMTVLEEPGVGPLVALGDEQGGVELVDLATGRATGERIHAHEGGSVTGLTSVPTPAGPLLVSGSTDGTARTWDARTGLLTDQIGSPGTIWVDDITALPTPGAYGVLVVKGDGTVTHWANAAGSSALPPVEAHDGRTCVTTCVTQDGTRLMVTAAEVLSVWDMVNSRLVYRWQLPAAEVRVLIAARMPGKVVTGHSDGSVLLCDVTTGEQTCFGEPGAAVRALTALVVDGRHVLAASQGDVILLWDVSRTAQPPRRLTGHSGAITALTRLTTAGRDTLLSSARDRTVRTWDQTALRDALKRPADASHTETHAAADMSDTDKPLLAVADAERVALWDTARGRLVREWSSDGAKAMTWVSTRSGRMLLWAASDGSIRRWDPSGAAEPVFRLKGHSQPVVSLASCLTSEGRRILVSGGRDHRVVLWDLASPPQHLRAWRHHELPVQAVAAASDQHHDWIASGGSDGVVRLWDMDANKPEAELRCDQGVVRTIAVNARPEGGLPPYLVSAGDDGTIRLWDLLTGQPLQGPTARHSAPVTAVAAWSTDGLGSFVASASNDGTLRIWDADGGRCLLQLATAGSVHTLSAHPVSDGHVTLVVAGSPGVIVSKLDLRNL
ncbi:hypothetical protein ACIQ7Q_30950 [Streptomyces sp. NPDC096176]|uniref:hypothetical protein n=1 Tax=Streptomyces sp. NPDC096176 TaxID=3366079 RepID=UPI00380915AA